MWLGRRSDMRGLVGRFVSIVVIVTAVSVLCVLGEWRNFLERAKRRESHRI